MVPMYWPNIIKKIIIKFKYENTKGIHTTINRIHSREPAFAILYFRK